ncbi:MAG: hypothetical protein A3C70_00165 [Candidatus Zambryskibacteria bacterium RIFCSPHIGHO2_02_FULL_43_14]|uniref:Uncharacterized protein n=1 Tax=Candidatus Zambryskibacteria bacterium RIFCSPHIGHO2_02_FULL_43_14 TaxID=1802748 RepID=A0A1G2TFB3_9BACT|nr:MAG: hypothetical protein A2829_03215 [Candidatus Zambryskibacteria bacterium RIFCSPHIGHO2_01_FULL_43_60]OHA95862.1 MAG: hypothetical protein A3C70_00165 [Candidatus Zambryskibacteria bacterium RIFCSPHIGHO2_02_FULL_43_14]
MSVILTIIVFNQSTYTDSTALTNLADEISSTISQTQVYGIAVKEFSTDNFNASYGLSFSILSGSNEGSNSAYLYFADRDGDKKYDGDWSCSTGGASECLSRIDITRGNVIEDLCIVRNNGADQCNVAKRVDISFARPSIEAQIKVFNSGGNEISASNDKGIKIKLVSSHGATRSVTVYKTGQVSVQ